MGMFLPWTRYCATSIKKWPFCMGNTLRTLLGFDAFGRLMNFPCLVKQIITDRRCLHCAFAIMDTDKRDDRALTDCHIMEDEGNYIV
jgi:hypothetical protein